MNSIRVGTRFVSNGSKATLIDLDLKDPVTGQYPRREIVEGETIQYDGKLYDSIHGNIYHDNFRIVGGDGFQGQIYPHRNGIAVMDNFTELPGVHND